MTGPVLDGRRAARGGWYLPPKVEDAPAFRYGCFGSATPAEFCGKAAAGATGSPEGALAGSRPVSVAISLSEPAR